MSAYEDEIVERSVELVVDFLRSDGPQFWPAIKERIDNAQGVLDPVYAGGLVDAVIWRRTADEVTRRQLVDIDWYGARERWVIREQQS